MQAQAAYSNKTTLLPERQALVFATTVIIFKALLVGLATHEAPCASEKKAVSLTQTGEKPHIIKSFALLFSVSACLRERASYRGLFLL